MFWNEVTQMVLAGPAHHDLSFSKTSLPHPSTAGFTSSIGEIKGQEADWRMPLADGRGVHVVEFESHYLVHWDHADPTKDPVGHLWKDAPHWVFFLTIGLFIMLGVGVYFLVPRLVDKGVE